MSCTIIEKLNYILETKDLIKTALQTQDVEVLESDTFRKYAEYITEIRKVSSVNGETGDIILKTINGTNLVGEGDIEIPSLEGYATEQWVKEQNYLTEHQSLEGYATEQWVENKGYLTEHQSLEGYATEQWVTNQGYLTEHQSLEEYAKKTEIPTKTSDLTNDSGYITLAEVPETDLSGYATEQWVTNQGYLTEHQSLEGYATEQWVENKGYLTEHQSLSGYATEQWVEDKGYLTEHQSLEEYAKKTEIPTKTSQLTNDSGYITLAEVPETDLSGYATEQWVENKGYLTEHQSLEGYATEQWVKEQNYLTEHQSLEGYATEQWVENKGYLTEHQSLENYYTKAETDALIPDISVKQDKLTAGEGISIVDNVISLDYTYDLFEVVQTLPTENISSNKIYIVADAEGGENNSYIEYIYVNSQWEIMGRFTTNVDLTGYATEQWVTNQGYLTEHQSLEGYATEQWVTNQGYLTEHQSLSGYATEQWVEDKGYLTEHQSLEEYAKKTEIPTKVSQLENDKGYLTEHQSLSGYATEQWVENKGYLQAIPDTYVTDEELSTAISDKVTTTALNEAINGVEAKIPTNVSQLTNDSGYITLAEVPETDLTGYATEQWVENKGYLTEHQSLSGYATEQWVEGKGYLTEHQSLEGYTKDTDFKTINGESIIGSGDLTIEGDGVKYIGVGENPSVWDTFYDGVKVYTSWIDLDDDSVQETLDVRVAGTLQDGTVDASTLWFGFTSADNSINLGDYSSRLNLQVNPDSFKTINGESIIGTGDIEIQGGEGTSYTAGDGIDITNDVISNTGVTAINIGSEIQDWTQKTGIVKMETKFYDGSYDVDIANTSFYGLKPVDNSILLENGGYTVNGNFRCGIKVNPDSFKTINGNTIVGEGDITIEGGEGTINIIELTQAEYDALTEYADNTFYVITDATRQYTTLAEVEAQGYTKDTDFKTINGNSIIGEGDITIEGGEGTASVSAINVGATIQDYSQYSGTVRFYSEINDWGDGSPIMCDLRIGDENGGALWFGFLSNDNSLLLSDGGGRLNLQLNPDNFKTINGNSIIGTGDIEIQGGEGTSYTAGDGIGIADNVITNTGVTAINIGSQIQDWTQKTGIVKMETKFYDGSYDVNIGSTSFYGLKPVDNSILLENAGSTVNGNFRCGIKVNPDIYYTKTEIDTLIGGVSDKITEINEMI